jgi:deazaflavin-dependent oxidoreductase (nitroreductase family)
VAQPTGILRLVFRLPVHLYRANLGWLLGHRGLLLMHRGRKSGRVYQTVLEVIRYDPATCESVVVSGWGERSDWYRNIKASPALEVRTGRERYAPKRQFLAPGENQAIISEYARRHPLTSRFLAKAFGYPLRGTDAARREFAESLRLVAFRPRAGQLCPDDVADESIRSDRRS